MYERKRGRLKELIFSIATMGTKDSINTINYGVKYLFKFIFSNLILLIVNFYDYVLVVLETMLLTILL